MTEVISVPCDPRTQPAIVFLYGPKKVPPRTYNFQMAQAIQKPVIIFFARMLSFLYNSITSGSHRMAQPFKNLENLKNLEV
jgi:hypothetical protein